MRRFFRFLFLAAGIATPLHAAQQATSVTVDQVSQILESSRRESDARLARQLSALQLTERADQSTLTKWQAEAPGKRARRALTELADASAFLGPPQSENSLDPLPQPAQMSEMIVRAIAYLKQSMPRLPNFYALRTTTHFADAPALHQDLRNFCNYATSRSLCLANTGAEFPSPASKFNPLQFENATVATVTYRDGQELTNQHSESAALANQQQDGLITRGEFGPILMVALGDALHGKIFWDSWQRGAAGTLAVFRYTVSQDKSHFMVSCPSINGAESVYPAYHGTFALDPSNGTVYRITMISDLAPPFEDQKASIAVEYETVQIGGTPYICPVRAVALSQVPVFSTHMGKIIKLPMMQTRLNDITFTRFHLFRAEMKILPDSAGSSSASPSSPAAATR